MALEWTRQQLMVNVRSGCVRTFVYSLVLLHLPFPFSVPLLSFRALPSLLHLSLVLYWGFVPFRSVPFSSPSLFFLRVFADLACVAVSLRPSTFRFTRRAFGSRGAYSTLRPSFRNCGRRSSTHIVASSAERRLASTLDDGGVGGVGLAFEAVWGRGLVGMGARWSSWVIIVVVVVDRIEAFPRTNSNPTLVVCPLHLLYDGGRPSAPEIVNLEGRILHNCQFHAWSSGRRRSTASRGSRCHLQRR